jgi:hypothetical protein
MNSKLTELINTNTALNTEFKKSKRHILERFGDQAGSLNFMQKAFVECVEAAKRDIEKRKSEQLSLIQYDKLTSPIASKVAIGAATTKNLPKHMTLEQFK